MRLYIYDLKIVQNNTIKNIIYISIETYSDSYCLTDFKDDTPNLALRDWMRRW